ncbi:DUF2160 domain-containing protein [Cereibacter sphaeroides]|uniref:DUF2160 domain-containing protein n=1 Tax=Cereibacter sphaeroides TaxID=1063 RepID=UPI001F39B97F|nr:DUF2160 domain-containing protein [Cereibacter sphaeroides]MCE6953126.1 DUF2160 domain-containing protein [Cereibacter sphaeroides]
MRALVPLGLLALMGGSLAALVAAVPRTGDGFDWFGQMVEGGWMAWSFPVAFFFWLIGSLLILMTVLAVKYPETPRVGVLRIETTRGDRLFISLLGSAFIALIWLGLMGTPLWGALALCLVYAAAVFRWV